MRSYGRRIAPSHDLRYRTTTDMVPKSKFAVVAFCFGMSGGSKVVRRSLKTFTTEKMAQKHFYSCFRSNLKFLVDTSGQILLREGDLAFLKRWVMESRTAQYRKHYNYSEKGKWKKPLLAASNGERGEWKDEPPIG